MFEPLNRSYRQVLVTFLLVLGGFLWSSPHAWAQG
jgi:hypothetical protein